MPLVHFRAVAVSVAESCARDAAVAVPKSHVTAGTALHLPRCVPSKQVSEGQLSVRSVRPESLAFLAQVTLTDDLESDRTRSHTPRRLPQLHGKGERKNEYAPKRGRRKLNFLAPASSLSYGRNVSLIFIFLYTVILVL